MKIVGIGDLLIPGKYIQEGFEPLNHEGNEVVIVDWKLSNYEELQNINLKVEQGGSEVYEPPAEIYAAAEEADILIVQFCTVTKKLIDHCKNLKAIGVLRGGIENVNLEYANEIGGAAIDVFEVEPPSKDYKMVVPENVTITPHLAGGTKDAFTHSPVLLAKEILKVLEDRMVSRSIVNLKMCKENAIAKMIG